MIYTLAATAACVGGFDELRMPLRTGVQRPRRLTGTAVIERQRHPPRLAKLLRRLTQYSGLVLLPIGYRRASPRLRDPLLGFALSDNEQFLQGYQKYISRYKPTSILYTSELGRSSVTYYV